jgi:predicted flap endonuclease-1-like 5' DNA nuclease
MYELYSFWENVVALPATDRLILVASGLLLFIIGVLLGWLPQRRGRRRAEKELQRVGRERDDAQRRLQEADAEQEKLAREVVQLTTTKDDTLLQLRNSRQTVAQQETELARLRAKGEQLAATNSSYATTIEDLNDQVIGLKTRNEQLLGQTEGAPRASAGSLERRVAALEAQLAEWKDGDGQEKTLILEHPAHRVTIGPSAEEIDPATGDDLTRIESIGPFNARQLAEAGIQRYDQIADWSEEDIDRYAERIGYPAELIRQADWVGQAQKLSVPN